MRRGDSTPFEKLQEAVECAREAFKDASNVYRALMAEVPSGLPQPDGSFRLTHAGERFREAMRAYLRAVQEMDTFVRAKDGAESEN